MKTLKDTIYNYICTYTCILIGLVLKYLFLCAYRFSCPRCCRYADFLTHLNDDRNIRALFERALSSLPPEKSVEVDTC